MQHEVAKLDFFFISILETVEAKLNFGCNVVALMVVRDTLVDITACLRSKREGIIPVF